MELDERLAKLEAIVAEDEGLERWERKALKVFKFVLFILALSAPIVWAFFEFMGFTRPRVIAKALFWFVVLHAKDSPAGGRLSERSESNVTCGTSL